MRIRTKNISFHYNGVQALRNVTFEMDSGDMIAIIGQNGSGKSTLLKCLNRILKIDEGEIEIGDQSLSRISSGELSRFMAYIPQSEEITVGINVFDTVLLGRKPYIKGSPSPDDLKIVAGLLSRLELESIAMRTMNTLSGGQQQQVFIARALAQQPSILLLDEPIANLDINHQMKVMKLLQQLSTEGITVVITIHDVNMAARFCNKALMLKQGAVFAFGSKSVYTPKNIENLYDIQVEVFHHKDCICIIPQNS
ncbi:ABC transporter ATP-binding protein [uncultured Sanguibacteroides sp.]|uniref:ABC transporter ATP-binding protein n=1 Tax=uncultured Sanguibacteroides sp. TaxID=1635151 RepID=UPI0025CE6FC0|nr:ABC transporter ATP-binding protein [uncultured Sanguibacteroides sp.]